MKYKILILIFIAANVIHGQIRIKITDSKTGKPVEYGEVCNDLRIVIRCRTAFDGVIEYTPPKKARYLIVSAFGYEAETIRIKSIKTKSIEVKLKPIEVDPDGAVVITSGRLHSRVLDLGYNIAFQAPMVNWKRDTYLLGRLGRGREHTYAFRFSYTPHFHDLSYWDRISLRGKRLDNILMQTRKVKIEGQNIWDWSLGTSKCFPLYSLYATTELSCYLKVRQQEEVNYVGAQVNFSKTFFLKGVNFSGTLFRYANEWDYSLEASHYLEGLFRYGVRIENTGSFTNPCLFIRLFNIKGE